MRIAIGSTSAHKIRAVREALQRLNLPVAELIAHPACSNVNAQPVGMEETLQGAQNRAEATALLYPEAICIGIESGIVQMEKFWVDQAIIVVLMPHGHQKFIGTSPAIYFPREYVDEARRRGFARTTVGSVIAEICGGDSTDPHTILTKGKITRLETLVEGIHLALAQIP